MEDVWLISPQDKELFERQFYSLNPVNGDILDETAKGFFIQSKLPPNIFGIICELADVNCDGKLNIDEFLIACKLVQMKLRSYNIPSSLPPSLLNLIACSGYRSNNAMATNLNSNVRAGSSGNWPEMPTYNNFLPKPLYQTAQLPNNNFVYMNATQSGSYAQKEYRVTVTHIFSPVEFYIRDVDNNDQFVSLTNQLNKVNLIAVDSPVGSGFMVLVMEHSNIYRGTILDASDETDCMVDLIDRGGIVVQLPIQSCYKVPKVLLDVPKLSQLCRLKYADNMNEDWSVADITIFRRMLRGLKNFQMEIVKTSTNCLEVELYLNNRIKVSDVFRSIVYGTDVLIEKSKWKTFKTSVQLIPDNEYDVRIVYVNDPASFYVEIYTDGEHELNNPMENISDVLVKKLSNRVYAPFVGMPIVFSEFKNKFHRAEILDVGQGKLAEKKFVIRLVDLGEERAVSWDSIYPLPQKLIRHSKKAIHCRLHGIPPIAGSADWCFKATDVLNQFRNTKSLLKLIVKNYSDDVYNVVLLDNDSNNRNICINSLLIEERLVAEAATTTTTTTQMSSMAAKYFKEERRQSNQKNAEQKEFVFKKNVPVNGNYATCDKPEQRIEVDIKKYVNPDEILVVNSSENQKFTKFIDSMTTFYYCNSYNITSVVNCYDGHTLYAMKIDDDYYRGKFLNEVSETEITVLLVDIGEIRNVRKIFVHPLKKQFKDMEQRALRKCHLHGIVPAGAHPSWPAEVCERLGDEIKKYKKFYIESKGDIINGSQPVILWGTNMEFCDEDPYRKTAWLNFNNFLMESRLALSSRRNFNDTSRKHEEVLCTNMNEVKIADTSLLNKKQKSVQCAAYTGFNWLQPNKLPNIWFIANITFVTTDLVLCVQHVNDVADLNRVNKFIQNHRYNDSLPAPNGSNYHQNQACIMKFCLDQKWYRGRIIEMRAKNATVECVDYGNTEEVDFNDLRSALVATEFPIFCSKIKTNEIMPARGNGEWDLEIVDDIHRLIVGGDKQFSITFKEDGDDYQAVSVISCDGTIDLFDYLVNIKKVARYSKIDDRDNKPERKRNESVQHHHH